MTLLKFLTLMLPKLIALSSVRLNACHGTRKIFQKQILFPPSQEPIKFETQFREILLIYNYNRMIYQVLISSLILAIHAELYCQNQGRPILTRTKTPPYRLTYQCLCPFDFYGG